MAAVRKVSLFGLDFQAFENVQQVALAVMKQAQPDTDRLPLMITPNVDQIVKLEAIKQAPLKAQLSKAQWILPDGQPIVALSKLKYKAHGLPARLTGSDFFPAMWSLLKQNPEDKVLFVLPNEDLGKRFADERDNVHYVAPPFFDLENTGEREMVLKSIASKALEVKPAYIFIGLGFPKQEYIALHLFDQLRKAQLPLPKTFLLGASFEFYWGLKKRAPRIWQKLGIEFLHRLLSEPGRMAKRYLVDDVAFFGIAWKEWRNSKNR